MKEFFTIYIAGINRSGGSLLSRLYDNHSCILSYPTELGFPINNNYYNVSDSYAGVPQSIPELTFENQEDVFDLLQIPLNKPSYSTEWGKEKADPLGVRDNYLEKNFYGNIKTYFNYDKFYDVFNQYTESISNIKELYDLRHYAYFTAWEDGRYFHNQSHVVMQDSGGIYLTNTSKYFNEFKDSIMIYPIRDIVGYTAAEKVRYARRFYGSRRFAWPQLPNYFVKKFDNYDIDAQVKGWMTALTRVRLLQEKYGIDDKFITYNHSVLTSSPEKTMKYLISKSKLEFENTLIDPTIAGKPWSGNSHYGPQKGISNSIKNNYKNVLRDEEISQIEKIAGRAIEISESKNIPVNLLDYSTDTFYDYRLQKKYFDNDEKITLYYALVNSSKRRTPISKAPSYSMLANIYSIIVRILHLPRMLKLKYFKGRGKQNYT